MVISGKQKAAILLMSLDAMTAAKLLKDVDAETVQELAVEVAYLDASGFSNTGQRDQVIRQFCSSLNKSPEFDIQEFLGTMLNNAVGQDRASRIQSQIRDLLQKRDPFIPIRQADPQQLSDILAGEHPQAASVVLSELSSKKSSEVLALLEEKLRLQVVTRMAAKESITEEAKMRIAQMVCGKLSSRSDVPAVQPNQAPRKVALMLRNLDKEIRDGLLSNITQKDAEAGQMITELMLIWKDIPEITDRSLQQILRDIDANTLALALIDADETIAQKITSNISERAAETLQEEQSLMAQPAKADIEQAREEIVTTLRGLNEKGELNFIEE